MAVEIPSPVPAELEEKFWQRVSRDDDGCWCWTANKCKRGYGTLHFWKTRQNVRAHRLSYVIHHGPIPDGMMICHRCDNPSCVRPDHLFAGTALDNNRDRDAKGRGKYYFQTGKGMNPHPGAENGLAKLTWEQVAAIRADPRFQTVIARDYGVDRSTIGRLKRGKSYAHPPKETTDA